MFDEFGVILVGALIFILAIILFCYPPNADSGYHSETKAFKNGEKMCDYYIEYHDNIVINARLLSCV